MPFWRDAWNELMSQPVKWAEFSYFQIFNWCSRSNAPPRFENPPTRWENLKPPLSLVTKESEKDTNKNISLNLFSWTSNSKAPIARIQLNFKNPGSEPKLSS